MTTLPPGHRARMREALRRWCPDHVATVLAEDHAAELERHAPGGTRHVHTHIDRSGEIPRLVATYVPTTTPPGGNAA